MSGRIHRAGWLALPALLAGLIGPLGRAAPAETAGERARAILDAAGAKGGLIVHLGCGGPGGPELTAALLAGDGYLVHGLEADPGGVAAARKFLLDKGLYGRATVSRLSGSILPYAEGLVNVLVVTGDKVGAFEAEANRVLAPGGVLVDARTPKLILTRKARPKDIDEWTHYLHDSTNNAVSADTVVAPPRGLRWTCGPAYARSHEHFGSVSAMVSAAGRVFYIQDEGPISSVFLPAAWRLVARDAFSGVLLWKRPITDWESHLRGFRSGPPEIGRRLVAGGGGLYVALGYGQAVTALDPATGGKPHVLARTEGARELLCRDGVLYVLADDMKAANHDERKTWIEAAAPTLKGYQFPRQVIPMYGRQRIVAVKADSGERLWEKPCGPAGEVMPATLAVADGRVCYQSVSHVVCLDAAGGQEQWRAERPVARSRFSWSTPTLVVHGGVVLSGDRAAADEADKDPPQQGSRWVMDNSHHTRRQPAELVALSLKDGKEMWRAPCCENYDTQMDIFVIDGVVWTGDLRHKSSPGYTQGRDLKTGQVVASLPDNSELYGIQMGHHRCYRNRATTRYLLLGRDGIELIDLKAGKGSGNWWVRGTCQYGVMPANGLIYAPHHSCACHPTEKLNGFNVLSPRSGAAGGQAEEPAPLEKGPAYGADLAAQAAATDWPTYRRDERRSGFQDLPAPQQPAVAWTKKFAAPVTAPVVAGGLAFIAETDRHVVRALSADDGAEKWAFVADGRIDSAPTIANGLCVFGTRNGFVYCLRASDGEKVWRFRAAPRPRLIFACEQLESAWPVHGAVLVDQQPAGGPPVVYFAAGRSSHIDGGIRLYALELKTGKVSHQAAVSMAGAAGAAGVVRERALPDVLSIQGGSVFMRNLRFGRDLAPLEARLPHLYAPGGFLDDTWWHRTYWMYGTTMMSAYGGWPRVGNMVPAGRLLVFDGGDTIYGYGRMAYRAGAGHVHTDAAKDYKLFAEAVAPAARPAPAGKGKAAGKRRRPARGRRKIEWSVETPFLARSVVLARDALLVAGGASLTETAARHGPGRFRVVARQDGAERGACDLPAPPILDGMAFTGSGVYVATIDGSLVCLRGKPAR